MPVQLDKKKVLEALATVRVPGTDQNIVARGLVRNIVFEGNLIKLLVQLDALTAGAKQHLDGAIRDALVKPYPGTPAQLDFAPPVGESRAQAPREQNAPQAGEDFLKNVKQIILVASGKGGVGKSTVAANMAAALHKLGYKVGLCDMDVYGPSIPTLFTITEEPKAGDNFLYPLIANGLKLMSIGYLVDADQAMIWRGPMLHSAIRQFLTQVAWGDLDYLVLDLPPGTGDVQLSISQTVNATGAVVVSTPQALALADVIRAKSMFDKVNVPILGVVENMAYFRAPDTGFIYDLFGRGGAKQMAERMELNFLAEVPMEIHVRELSDRGTPVAWARPESDSGKAFFSLARNVAKLAPVADGTTSAVSPQATLAQLFATAPGSRELFYTALELTPGFDESVTIEELSERRAVPLAELLTFFEQS